MFKYSDKQLEFIKSNYKGITTIKLTELFNNEFNENVTLSQIKNHLFRNGLKNGVVKRFEKGHIPANKGTKGISKPNKTSFKKGNIPKNYRPVGSERINRDGYAEVKIADPRKWELKHRLIYKEAFGEIPKNCVLFFLDQDKSNLDLDNLILVSKQESLILNKELRLSNDANVNKTRI